MLPCSNYGTSQFSNIMHTHTTFISSSNVFVYDDYYARFISVFILLQSYELYITCCSIIMTISTYLVRLLYLAYILVRRDNCLQVASPVTWDNKIARVSIRCYWDLNRDCSNFSMNAQPQICAVKCFLKE